VAPVFEEIVVLALEGSISPLIADLDFVRVLDELHSTLGISLALVQKSLLHYEGRPKVHLEHSLRQLSVAAGPKVSGRQDRGRRRGES
jgi:hypothetical protein